MQRQHLVADFGAALVRLFVLRLLRCYPPLAKPWLNDEDDR